MVAEKEKLKKLRTLLSISNLFSVFHISATIYGCQYQIGKVEVKEWIQLSSHLIFDLFLCKITWDTAQQMIMLRNAACEANIKYKRFAIQAMFDRLATSQNITWQARWQAEFKQNSLKKKLLWNTETLCLNSKFQMFEKQCLTV